MPVPKRLYSLGDSFMTTDHPSDGIDSFCALYCQTKGFEHVSLARPGATNFAIRLQIDQAIQDRADFVVLGATSADRFDVVLDGNDRVAAYQLCHILYSGYRALSEHSVDQSSVKLVSDTFNNIVERVYQNKLVTDQQIKCLKNYLAYLHNYTLASQKDYYVISDGVRKLQSRNIDFVLIPGWLSQFDWSWVSNQWPRDRSSPYDMPYGPSDWEKPVRFTGTHNPAWAHREFCETLLTITQHWS